MTSKDEIERGIQEELEKETVQPEEWGYRSLEDVDPDLLWKKARGQKRKKAVRKSKTNPRMTRKFELRRELARIEQGMSLQSDSADGDLDAILCPKCQRRIIPQFTYTGRRYALFIEHFGLEKHGTARFCPLCGVDIDGYIEEVLSELRKLESGVWGEGPFFLSVLFLLAVMALSLVAWVVQGLF